MRNIERIVLVGFMGTGKSTVGRRLARTLEWNFVDTDAEIEALTGLTVAEIFRRHGEKRFRSEENLLVKRLSHERQCVIATGGGTVLNPENWELLRHGALTIHLYAPVDVILERVGQRSDRPLLKGSREEIEALWQTRLATYRQADWTVDTTVIDVEQVEEEILVRIERLKMTSPATWQKVEVSAGKPYPVMLGVKLEELGSFLKQRAAECTSILVVTNPTVAGYHLDRLLSGLDFCPVHVLTVPEGEGEKTLERLGLLTTEAVQHGADRGSLVLALGGGVIGDLAGFFAACFMRGINFVQVPTTFLAQVDSSIGGKVAVDHPAGKNLLGAFYPPIAVWTDFSTLNTLPWHEVQNGLAETVKHALIADRELFEFIEEHAVAIKQRIEGVWREVVTRSLAVKVKIVSQDEKEHGMRALLNLGHTFGHALETAGGYTGVSHGQGVSVGLVAAAALAQSKGLISAPDVTRIIELLNNFGLPTTMPDQDPRRLLELMKTDKKNRSGRKVLILPKGIGSAVVARECTDDEILEAWTKVKH